MEMDLDRVMAVDTSKLQGLYHTIAFHGIDDVFIYLVSDTWFKANSKRFKIHDNDGEIAEMLYEKAEEKTDDVFTVNTKREYINV